MVLNYSLPLFPLARFIGTLSLSSIIFPFFLFLLFLSLSFSSIRSKNCELNVRLFSAIPTTGVATKLFLRQIKKFVVLSSQLFRKKSTFRRSSQSHRTTEKNVESVVVKKNSVLERLKNHQKVINQVKRFCISRILDKPSQKIFIVSLTTLFRACAKLLLMSLCKLERFGKSNGYPILNTLFSVLS